ncbi:T9SS type A sorting domain-containing protein [Polluticaenibacter yanchengensis]|uniref:T9SS type A sorting domain-containing protein n=1 Tax=Polluticaenibacter yanchengensis TaxID=3014562 RepID=A0ABT4UK32_9BACT|nr:T9SS type A sorting domain-containing protein [Chitinophagaceae bacterium LY-5]
MKRILATLLFFICHFADAQNNLKIVAWNMSWFGSASNGPSNLNLQQQNATTVFKDLAADIYAVCEVVDTARLGNVARSLGKDWVYVVSPMASNAFSITTSGYAGSYAVAQKLAFVFDSSKVSLQNHRSMINATSFSAGQTEIRSWWSNGRFPYLLEAVYKRSSVNIPLKLVLIHGKANVGSDADKVDSYNKRFNAINQLKDTLDNQFKNDNIVLLGDFNDDLLRTIAPMADTISSYVNLVKDSVGTQHYYSATLPLSRNGSYSVIGYDNVIDNIVISSELKSNYVANSTTIHTEFINKIGNYRNTTSDHLPVSILFRFNEDLPNHLFLLTGKKESGMVYFKWQQNIENVIRLGMEQSVDGTRYDLLDDNLIYRSDYNAAQLNTGRYFYRLKAVTAGGEIFYSNVLQFSTWEDATFVLYPNPVKDRIYFNNGFGGAPVNVKIIAADGKVLLAGTISGNQLDVNILPKGIYRVVLDVSGEVLNRSFIKE